MSGERTNRDTGGTVTRYELYIEPAPSNPGKFNAGARKKSDGPWCEWSEVEPLIMRWRYPEKGELPDRDIFVIAETACGFVTIARFGGQIPNGLAWECPAEDLNKTDDQSPRGWDYGGGWQRVVVVRWMPLPVVAGSVGRKGGEENGEPSPQPSPLSEHKGEGGGGG